MPVVSGPPEPPGQTKNNDLVALEEQGNPVPLLSSGRPMICNDLIPSIQTNMIRRVSDASSGAWIERRIT
jgi:hypothetical protein